MKWKQRERKWRKRKYGMRVNGGFQATVNAVRKENRG